MSLRSTLLDFLRVPHAPSAPEGDHDVQIFRAAPNYFWYKSAGWLLKNCGAVIGLWFALGFAAGLPGILPDQIELGALTISERTIMFLVNLVEYGAVAAFIAQAVFSFTLLRLDFEQRWYIVSDRSLRIREGLVQLREQTVTFANVQHVSIRQNPLQRLLGIADLQVRTAGGKGSSEGESGEKAEDLHVARFRGIANPETVREAIRERLRQHRDAGLGDPDDALSAPHLLHAARELADEARSLRLSLAESA